MPEQTIPVQQVPQPSQLPQVQQIPPVVGTTITSVPQQQILQPQVQQQVPVSPLPGSPMTSVIWLKQQAPLIKQWSQLSFGGLLIGCGVFILLIVWFLWWSIYYLMNNPELLTQVGMDWDTAKTLFWLFWWLFFISIFFGWFGLAVVNWYRIFSTPWPKWWYIAWLIIGIIITIGTLVWGIQLISMITNTNTDIIGNWSNAVSTYIMQWQQRVSYTNQPLIAPISLRFWINNAALQWVLWPQIPLSSVTSIVLSCGNTQLLPLGVDWLFQWVCLYTAKQSYVTKLIIRYPDSATQELLTGEIPLDPVAITSVLWITTSQWSLKTNDSMTELVISKPMRVFFDASRIVSDLWLTSNDISWDFDWDGEDDISNISKPSFVYKDSKLYTISYRIWNQRQRFYVFLRVEESTDPQCNVSGTWDASNNYKRDVVVTKPNIRAKDYRREIVDASTNRVLQTIKRTNPSLTQVLSPWSYIARVVFLSDDNRQWTCETDIIDIAETDMDATLSIQYKIPTMNDFVPLTATGVVLLSGDVVMVGSLPTYLTVSVWWIMPSSSDIDVQLLFNSKRILETVPWVYELTITDSKDQILELVLTNKNTNKTKKIVRNIKNTQAKVLWALTILPDTAGMDPFEVTLDVSRIRLTDSTDEIVAFTRDFWDWEISKNVNQWTITHVYRFDAAKQSGEYRPSVTIKTKKWVTQTISSVDPIIVKRATRTIQIKTDSHPSQIAAIGDRVQLRIESNGSIESIRRDYGDGREIQECEGRSCIDTTAIYKEPGMYTVKATINYTDHPPVSSNLKIKVE